MDTSDRSARWSLAACLTLALGAVAAAPLDVTAQSLEELSDGVREFVTVSAPHFVLRDVKLIDGTGAPARERMAVEVRGGRITRVVPNDEYGVPTDDGLQVIDGSGHTLMPGLVMLHEHLFYPSGSSSRWD